MIDQIFSGTTSFLRQTLSIFMIGICFFFSACNSHNKAESYPSPKSYNLNKPYFYILPPELDEISGIVYYPKDKAVFAIHDERGWLYKIYLDKKVTIKKWKYAHGADFEDLVVVDSTFYALQSNGIIIAFRFISPDSITERSYQYTKGGKKEFEVLYPDPTRKKLIMVCKDCETDEKSRTSAIAFDNKQEKFLDSPAFVIDAGEIEKKLGKSMGKFKPSAAAINPLTGKLYIVSSVNKLLVITDMNGKIEEVYPLNSKLFKQPEGLAFTPAGDLLISNESADIGPANILLFKINESTRQ